MKHKLIGRVNEYTTEFENVEDYIKSDYLLYSRTGQDYELFYNGKRLITGLCFFSFDEVRNIIKQQIEDIDNELL